MRKYNKNQQSLLNSIPIFLSKTYQIVDNLDYKDIIEWSEDGNSFIIKDIALLTTNILSKHFKHNNFASFVRQLNMYGFHKIRSSNQGHVFQHQYFRRDNIDLLPQIKRRNANVATGTPQETNQSQLVLAVSGNRQEELQKEVSMLSGKHSDLQNVVSMLIEQNKQIIMQNRQFVMKMNKMKQKYTKKLQTLIWMVLLSQKNSQKGFVIPPQAANMLRALRQNQSQVDNNQALEVFKGKKKQKKQNPDDLINRMLKNDSQLENNDLFAVDQSSDLDNMIKKISKKQDQKVQTLEKSYIEDPLFSDDQFLVAPKSQAIPSSPIPSQLSQKNQWNDLLDKFNNDEHSDFDLSRS